MGLFGKHVVEVAPPAAYHSNPISSNAIPPPRRSPGNGRYQVNEAETEQLRSQLGNLFGSEPNGSERVSRKPAILSESTGNGSSEYELGDRNPSNVNISSASHSTDVSPRGFRAGTRRHLSRKKSSAVFEETHESLVALSLEDGTSPYQFPDVEKSDGQSRWSNSPRRQQTGMTSESPSSAGNLRNSTSSIGVTRHSTSSLGSRRMSESRRSSFSSRPNSLSRFARRASNKMKTKSHFNAENVETAIDSAREAEDVSERAGSAILVSPITPHDDDEGRKELRNYGEKPASYFSLEEFTEEPKGAALESEKGQNRQQAHMNNEKSGYGQFSEVLPLKCEVEENDHENKEVPLAKEKPLSPKRTTAGKMVRALTFAGSVGRVDVPPTPKRSPRVEKNNDWSNFDVDDFADEYALEAATAREFNDRQNRAPACNAQDEKSEEPHSTASSKMHAKPNNFPPDQVAVSAVMTRELSLPNALDVSQIDPSADWKKFDVDDYFEAFALEFAISRQFDSRLNNSPASNTQISSDGSSGAGLGTAIPAAYDATARVSANGGARKRELFPSKSPNAPLGLGLAGEGKAPEKAAGKRPPRLITPEPASSNSSEPSPSTCVFASNGDFQTGQFRITMEGMVGKPEKATRKDSDDAPETGYMPVTMADITLVRSLVEFRQGPTLGMGAAGRVYLAIHEPSGKSMANKVVNVYDEAKRNQLLKELETLSCHVSRFLVRFYGAFYDGKGAVHIALEYMDGGCLSSTVNKFGAIPEPVTRMITVDCLRALRFLHRNSVLHRDFKTANILLSRKSLCAKVSDFGLARDMDAGVSRAKTFVGTIAYMSPERLNGGTYTYASDIWALGISIAECLLGRYPFEKPQSYFDYLDVTDKDVLKGARGISPLAADFVYLCVNADPLKRPTAVELMQHPWLAGKHRDPVLFKAWMENMDYHNSKDVATVKSMQTVQSFLGDQQRKRP